MNSGDILEGVYQVLANNATEEERLEATEAVDYIDYNEEAIYLTVSGKQYTIKVEEVTDQVNI